MPSRFAACLVLALAFTAFTAAGADRAAAATARLGLSYDIDSSPAPSPASQNELDLYTPDAPSAELRPVVVYVHGGAWVTGDKANGIGPKVELFTRAGYVFASVNYRLSPNGVPPGGFDPGRVKFPDHPRDVGEAIAWLSRNVARFGGDPNRIALIGHSAGAHLVSLVSTDPSYLAAYGVAPWQLIGTVSLDIEAYDIPTRLATGGPMAAAVLYNAFGTPAENAATDSWSRGSPLNWAGRGDPPFLLVTQAAEPDRVAQTERMAAALREGSGADVFLAPYDHEGINDAVGSPSDPAGETAAIMSFFARSIAAAAEPRAKLRRHPPRRLVTSARRALVRFKLAPNLPGATIRCRLGKGKLKACGLKPRFRTGPGKHTFRYQATSARGRPGPIQKFTFRVRQRGRAG